MKTIRSYSKPQQYPNKIYKTGSNQYPIRRSSRVQAKIDDPPVYFTEEEYQKEQKEASENVDNSSELPKDKKQIELELKQQKASNYSKLYKPGCLNNLNFVLRGALSVPRGLATNLIRKNGGCVQSNVINNTNYVVVGENGCTSVTTSKAKQLKIPTISEDQLFKLLRGGKILTVTGPDSIPEKKYIPLQRIVKKTITRKPRTLKKKKYNTTYDYYSPEEAEMIIANSIASAYQFEEELRCNKYEQFI